MAQLSVAAEVSIPAKKFIISSSCGEKLGMGPASCRNRCIRLTRSGDRSISAAYSRSAAVASAAHRKRAESPDGTQEKYCAIFRMGRTREKKPDNASVSTAQSSERQKIVVAAPSRALWMARGV